MLSALKLGSSEDIFKQFIEGTSKDIRKITLFDVQKSTSYLYVLKKLEAQMNVPLEYHAIGIQDKLLGHLPDIFNYIFNYIFKRHLLYKAALADRMAFAASARVNYCGNRGLLSSIFNNKVRGFGLLKQDMPDECMPSAKNINAGLRSWKARLKIMLASAISKRTVIGVVADAIMDRNSVRSLRKHAQKPNISGIARPFSSPFRKIMQRQVIEEAMEIISKEIGDKIIKKALNRLLKDTERVFWDADRLVEKILARC